MVSYLIINRAVSMNRMHPFFKKLIRLLSLVAIDLMAFYLSLFLATFIRTEVVPLFIKEIPGFFGSWQNAVIMWWIPLIYIFFIQYQRLYFTHYPFWEETRNIIKALTVAFFFVFVAIYLSGLYGKVFRILLILLWFVSLFLFPVFRFWGKKLLFKLGIWRENVVIIGTGENAVLTVKGLLKEAHLGYNVVGFLKEKPKKSETALTIGNKSYPIFGDMSRLDEIVRQYDIETVFIANPYNTEDLNDIINYVYHIVKRVVVIPDLKGVAIFNSELHFLFMEKVFMINIRNNLNSRTNTIAKRIFDLALCVVLLPVVTPLILFLMLLIKIDSKGPALFLQDRVGKNEKIFKTFKFRSMHIDAEEKLKHILETDAEARDYYNKYWKLKDDPRITGVGKFLRKTSMDEWPQIFNVLNGTMSFIGPRPYLPSELEKMGDMRNIIFSVKPGMTGLWQVSGRSDTKYDFRIQTDAWYVQNWSMWLDIMILMRTPLAVLKTKGAY